MRALQAGVRPTGSDADPMSSNGAVAKRATADPGALTPIVRESRVRKVLEMIETQPSRSVRELALEVRLSPAHLERLFKQETGVHVHDLLVEHRLRKAAHLLAASDMPVKEIAYTVGYAHHSSFVRAFEHRFAQTPGHYRRQSHIAKC